MTVRYHCRTDGTTVPDYVCQHDGIQNATPICQHMPGAIIDAAVAALLLATLTPLALEVALTVSNEADPARPSTPTRCAPPPSSAPSTPPTRPAAATWPSTPATGWSPTPSKPTGTPGCAS